ncbi:DNA-binding protein [Ectopseudomonas toyotomiensis]|uniref:Helix-turn-helix domain-containing protein n=1 Tax=Ectopseudomonas toyotomiensis TaxID=554344 RepID=A0A1I5W0B0_9GAMM|nr:helix-turn-helix domain-containing protein [Pseudomonas toyotomiensis]PIA72812.1 DNA-binding protein [Pseudomonas toyotomiensis]SFQ13093.1 Helix-turn-helix domain-containing protein [Pseudomonas toyotomiensis]
MLTSQSTELATLKAEIAAQIAAQLGFNPETPPVNVDDKSAAAVLGVQKSTLSVWRSLGRYNLPYVKIGRSVKYRISDLAEFIANRTASNTGEAN